MKGFFSFVVLLSLILLIIHSSYYFSHSNPFSTAKFLAVERIYQLEMNLKESMLEGAKEGAAEGLAIYLLLTPVEEFNIKDAEQYIKVSAHEKLSSLNSVEFEGFEFKLWCGDPSKKKLSNLKKKMLMDNELLICSDCKPVEDLNCIDYLEPEFSLEIKPGELPTLSSVTIGNEEAVFGISIYSEKFKISSAFLLPKEKVMILE